MLNKKSIYALNTILSFGSDAASDTFKGVDTALKSNLPLRDSPEIAKSLLKIYDEDAVVESIVFDDVYFDPLFAMIRLKEVLIRLTGYKRSILIIESLSQSSLNGRKRSSIKSCNEYANNVRFIEDFAKRYEAQINNLEIIFL